MCDSEPDGDFSMVLPKDFSKYISNVKILINYANKVISRPQEDNPSKGLEELAYVKSDLLKHKEGITEYIENLNHWEYKPELGSLKRDLAGRLFMLDGQIPNLQLLLMRR